MLNTSSRKRLRSLRAEAIQIEDDPRAFGENTPESDAQEAGMPGTRGGAEAAGAKQARRRATGGLTTDRRSRHNAVERKRQQQLSSYISELGEFLEVCTAPRTGALLRHALCMRSNRGISAYPSRPHGCARHRSTGSRCVGIRSAS